MANVQNQIRNEINAKIRFYKAKSMSAQSPAVELYTKIINIFEDIKVQNREGKFADYDEYLAEQSRQQFGEYIKQLEQLHRNQHIESTVAVHGYVYEFDGLPTQSVLRVPKKMFNSNEYTLGSDGVYSTIGFRLMEQNNMLVRI